MSEVLFDVDDCGIGTLTINRPEVRNGLNWAAMRTFADTVEQAYARPDLRVLIVTGAGSAFASGGDINELQNYPSRADGARLTEVMGDALCRLESLPCPTIAAINGPARGGGAEISLACDMRVMAEDADIGFVQARLGIVTAWGGGQRLLRAIGYSRALELMVTGRILRAAEALGLRLVTALAPAGEALAHARALAAQIAANPPAATRAAKRLLRANLTHAEGLAFEAERAEFPALWDTEFRREAVRKFLGREKPVEA
ncbi:MAG TPA: enoyl-CoA hydratase/isomerase family protein [Chloroflexia bacterium]|nr:enoyl-CoA hydratase/isomerase family protein [Chloroflexia bacterium]